MQLKYCFIAKIFMSSLCHSIDTLKTFRLVIINGGGD